MKKQLLILMSTMMLVGCSTTTSKSSKESVQTSTPVTTQETDGVDADYKAAIDSYVEFYEKYAEFMKTYDSSNVSALTEYTELLKQLNEMNEKWKAVGEKEMSKEEMDYYIDANAKIQKLLLEVTQ